MFHGPSVMKMMALCVSLSHFAVEQRLAQHCRSTILQLKNKSEKKKENDGTESPNKKKSIQNSCI